MAGTGSGSGNGGGFVPGTEPMQRPRRVGLSRRRQSTSKGTSFPNLQLGAGFSIDLRSPFFNCVPTNSTGRSTFTQGESSRQGGSSGIDLSKHL
jgi:hypothetical protein